jgi:pimeloyl-ACP methyl ester carboxylesterase
MQTEYSTNKFTESCVEFSSQGNNLYGILASPPKIKNLDNKDTIAIMLHGWGTSRSGPHRMFVSLSRKLAETGISSFRFDFQGRGYSEGEYSKTTLDKMIENVLASVKYFEEKQGKKKIVLIGICSGGNVALGATSLLKSKTEKLFCLSTLPFCPPEGKRKFNKLLSMLKVYLRKACSFSTWQRFIKGEVNLSGAGQVLVDSASQDSSDRSLKDSSRDIISELAGFSGDAHFIYGSADPEAKEAEEYYKKFFNKNNINFIETEIEGANHNFFSHKWTDKVFKYILSNIAT